MQQYHQVTGQGQIKKLPDWQKWLKLLKGWERFLDRFLETFNSIVIQTSHTLRPPNLDCFDDRDLARKPDLLFT